MSVTNTLLNETQPVEQQQEAYRSDHRTRLSSIPVPCTPWERRENAVGTPWERRGNAGFNVPKQA